MHGGGAPRTAAPTSRTQPGLLSLCNTTMSQAAITTLRYQDDMDASTSASRSTLLLFIDHHGGSLYHAVLLFFFMPTMGARSLLQSTSFYYCVFIRLPWTQHNHAELLFCPPWGPAVYSSRPRSIIASLFDYHGLSIITPSYCSAHHGGPQTDQLCSTLLLRTREGRRPARFLYRLS